MVQWLRDRVRTLLLLIVALFDEEVAVGESLLSILNITRLSDLRRLGKDEVIFQESHRLQSSLLIVERTI